MKAVQVMEHGEVVLGESPEPILKPDEVLVKVAAAGVNRADLLQRLGRYPVPSWASPILGLEVSGIIEAVGDEVIAWKIGDRVASLIEGGGYAEKVAIPAGYLLPVPETSDLIEAAAMPEAFLTSFLNIYLEGEAKPGEVVLVHAAASGVGTAALQLCQELGNPVFATASTSKLEQVRKYNPIRAIDRHTESFLDVIKGSDERGVDIILDLVGGSYFEDNIRVMKRCGRLIVIGLLGGSQAPLRLDQLLAKRLRVVGSVIRGRSKEEKYSIIDAFKERVWPLYEEKKIVPVIDSLYPIEAVAEAHDKMHDNRTVGKILLTL